MSTPGKLIKAPFSEDTAENLRAGESVRISGSLLLARDAAHKRLVECLEEGQPLPCNLRGEVIYYAGPSPAKPGQVIGSCGPTTSGRMDKYTPFLIYQGLKGMIGKGERSQEVVRVMQKYKVPYLVAVGGAGALIAKTIKSYQILAWEDLGPEALARVEVEDFPAICVLDCLGHNYYEIGQARFKKI
ncbi:MAG: Fe-S-containing hydro-lyase [Desulfovibrionaceae bacterium]|nr:Fe-S-containing hydro-lyase [Desulfovibrionaceae bacterium]